MKSLLIESVTNGWIVRPFTPTPDVWARGDEVVMAVYTSIKDLQSDLPKLLDAAQLPDVITAGDIPVIAT